MKKEEDFAYKFWIVCPNCGSPSVTNCGNSEYVCNICDTEWNINEDDSSDFFKKVIIN